MICNAKSDVRRRVKVSYSCSIRLSKLERRLTLQITRQLVCFANLPIPDHRSIGLILNRPINPILHQQQPIVFLVLQSSHRRLLTLLVRVQSFEVEADGLLVEKTHDVGRQAREGERGLLEGDRPHLVAQLNRALG